MGWKKIETNAFEYSVSLKRMKIPESVTCIREDIFSHYNKLKDLE